MKSNGTPILDPRHADQIFDQLISRQPAYLPDWTLSEGQPSLALLRIFARYMEVVIERLNQAPDKNLLAFLDMLGLSLIPAQAARAPVVFQPLPFFGNGRLAARTRLGAEAGQPDPLIFETDRTIAIAAARLVDVKTLWPTRDTFADHTEAFAGSRPFTLFEPQQPVPHILYLAHNTLLAFSVGAMVEIEFELARPGSKAVKINWEYWDGQVWRPFESFEPAEANPSLDGTAGLTRSGVVTLRANCGQSKRTTIQGIEANWLRGQLDLPFPPDPDRVLAEVDAIRLRSAIERPVGIWSYQQQELSGSLAIRGTVKDSEGNPLPDVEILFKSGSAFSRSTDAQGQYIFDGLDITPNVTYSISVFFPGFPILQVPDLFVGNSTLQVDFFLDRGLQPDQALANTEQLDLSTIFFPFGRFPDQGNIFYLASEEIFSKAGATVTLSFHRAVTPAEEADQVAAEQATPINDLFDQLLEMARGAAETVRDAAQAILMLPGLSADQIEALAALSLAVESLETELASLEDTFPNLENLLNITETVLAEILDFPSNNALQASLDEIKQAASAAFAVLTAVQELSLADLAALQTANSDELPPPDEQSPPALSPPRLVWEYWDGSSWKHLIGPVDDPPANFLESGEIVFSIPPDLASTVVNDIDAHWIRARLASGSYSHLRLVSWYSTLLKKINFSPIIEPRPPALENMILGYSYHSPWQRPEHCLTYNDFQFEYHTADVRWPGNFFPPFRPVADTTPALYLGFDQPLPNDLVSLYLNIREQQTTVPPLVWEGWNGTVWQELAVTDETVGLRRPGMVSFIAPPVARRPQANISQAGSNQITLQDALAGAVFQPGQQIVARQNGEPEGELVTVQSQSGNHIRLETPLQESYVGGTISLAALPRFGMSRDWIRARLKQDGAPARSQINGLYLNATWASQTQTIENELLGSGLGQPNQALFFTQVPVLPGEQIEVRELEGSRAEVELPILRESLLKQGFTDADIRVVSDPRSGQTTEVWVRWQARNHLFFSSPNDRHYLVERARGRLIFGDGQYGRQPTVGANNIQARRYRAGGGLAGNVPAGAITQLLGVAPFVQGVTNPRTAEGGAEAETVEAIKQRGPQKIRHRGRALAARDYEALALEATPGVAVARALPATAPNLRPAPGWVTVIIVPQSQDLQPQPTFELRRQVQSYLVERAPATVAAERIAVIGPTYLPVGVAARIAPRQPDQAGLVEGRVRAALQAFLHPLGGGPDGQGWPFGRDVYLSDVATILEAIAGVDYVTELNLLLNGTPQGEEVAVPPDRIVVAGPLEIEMKAA